MSELSSVECIRNFGIIAHIDAGKTTVSERILYYTHKIARMGEVHDGNSTMDFMPEEQERGITIVAASTFCEWENHALNFIDTPGHVDFTIEVERSLRVLDGAVGIFCAVNGVEPQSETVWRQSEALAVPKLAFINKMDKVGADFEFVLDSMINKLNAHPILIQLPLFKDDTFYAIADLIRFVKFEFDEEDEGETIIESELIDDEVVLASLWREKMLESLADLDETFLDKYVQEIFQENDIHNALRRVCIKREAVPTLVGAARKNKGVQPLLDAICHFLPSPLESMAYMQNTSLPHFSINSNTFKALVFKLFPQFFDTDENVVLIRLYNGSLQKGNIIYNLSQNNEIHILNMYRLHADFYEEIDTACLGEIIAFTGSGTIKTGDTLIAQQSSGNDYDIDRKKEVLESISNYQPVISLAFEAKNQEEAVVLQGALKRYVLEDPTLTLENEEGGNFLVSGMGELHLEILKERIVREYKITPRTGNPQVVLCQSLKANKENPFYGTITFAKKMDDILQEAEITLSLTEQKEKINNQISFSENAKNQINIFSHKASDKNLDNVENIIQNTAQETLHSGSAHGYQLLGIHVTIESINITEKSTYHAFSIATHLAIKEALNTAEKKEELILLEPIMYLEIVVPDENLSACMNLIQSASGTVSSFTEKANLKCVIAHAPMRELFGFATRLRSVSQGRANLLMRFQKYAQI